MGVCVGDRILGAGCGVAAWVLAIGVRGRGGGVEAILTAETTCVKARLLTDLHKSRRPSCVGVCITPITASMNACEVAVPFQIQARDASNVAPSSAAFAVLEMSAAASVAATCSVEGLAKC